MATNSAGVNFGTPNEEFIIESDGSGALTSARNAVTGDEYVGGGMNVETYGHNFVVKNTRGSNLNVTFARMNIINDVPEISLWPQTLSNNQSVTVTKAILFDGIIIVSIPTANYGDITCTNCTAEIRSSSAPSYKYLYVTVTDISEDCQIIITAA